MFVGTKSKLSVFDLDLTRCISVSVLFAVFVRSLRSVPPPRVFQELFSAQESVVLWEILSGERTRIGFVKTSSEIGKKKL